MPYHPGGAIMQNFAMPDLQGHQGRPCVPGGPKGVTILTTYACNSRCINCSLWKSKMPAARHPDLALQEYERIFSDELFSGITGYGISGGEASLSPLTSQLMTILPGHVNFLMATNSVSVSKVKPLMKRMAERGNSYLMISVDGIGEMSDRVRGIDGHFRNVMELLDYCKELGLPRVISSTLNTVNCHELRQLYALSEIYDAGFHFRAVTEGGYYNSSEEQKILGQFSEKQIRQLEDDIDWLVERLVNRNKNFSDAILAHFLKIPDYLRGTFTPTYCLAGDSMFMLDPSGECLPCPSYYNSMGNLRDHDLSLSKLWHSSQAAAVRHNAHTVRCGGCWNDCQWPSNLGSVPMLVSRIMQEYTDRQAKRHSVGRTLKAAPPVQVIGDSSKFAHMGRNVHIGVDADIRNPQRIVIQDGAFIGNNVWLNITHDQLPSTDRNIRISIGKRTVVGRDSFISASDSVVIGDNVLIAPNVHIADTGHNFGNVEVPMIDQGVIRGKPVKVGDNCWIGINAVILPGVEIGEGCIIGANAVVTKSIPPRCIAGGNPARIIKMYDPLELDFVKVPTAEDVETVLLHRRTCGEEKPSREKIASVKKSLAEPVEKPAAAVPGRDAILSMYEKTSTNVRISGHLAGKMTGSSIQVAFDGTTCSVPLSNYAGPNFPTLFDPQMAELLEIAPTDRVLDIGGGANPFSRADVVVDAFPDNSVHRAWRAIPTDKRYCIARGERLPFKDKSFDFIYSRHALEHVDDPLACMQEIMRVGKRGFFEVPNSRYDQFMGGPTHSWAIDLVDGAILYRRRPYVESPLKYALYKIWQEDRDFRFRMEIFFRNLFFIQFYWEDSFVCVVDDDVSAPQRYDLDKKDIALRSHFDFGREMFLQGSSMYRAEPELRHVLEMDPGHTRAGILLATLYMKTGKPQDANRCLQQVLEHNPQHREAEKMLASIV